MDKLTILDLVIEKQEEILSNIQNTIKVYKTASDIDEDNTLDPEDFSHQGEARDLEMILQEKVKNELTIIDNIQKNKTKAYHKIEEGALIETNFIYIYVGFAANPFKIGNKDVFCISTDAPLFQIVMKKNIGDSFEIGNITHSIINIS